MALVALLAAAACQSMDPPQAVEPAPSWRVVEWLGEVRLQRPGDAEWQHVGNAGLIPGGSRVVTGRGGRLILAEAGRQVIAGTGSELRLPDLDDPRRLRQVAGQVRYRVEQAPPGPLMIETPFAAVEVARAILEVSVASDGTEVRVEDGAARIETPDGLAGTSLRAGEAGLAVGRGPDYQLARRGADGVAEQVPPVTQVALEGASAMAKQRAPEARLVAEVPGSGREAPAEAVASMDAQETADTFLPGAVSLAAGRAAPLRGIVALSPSSPRGVGALAGASAGFEPAAFERSAHRAIEPAPPAQAQVVAQLGQAPRPMMRPTAPLPATRPADDAASGDAGAVPVGAADSPTGSWAERAPPDHDVVIVPASYRKARSQGGPGGRASGGAMAAGMREPGVAAAQLGRAGGASQHDERQDPFDRLGAGLLDGLAAAEIRLGPAPVRATP